MGNKFLNLFKNKKIVFLFILLVLVLIAGLSYKLVEGFDLGGLTSGSSSSSSGFREFSTFTRWICMVYRDAGQVCCLCTKATA
jgi:hypothetical protein